MKIIWLPILILGLGLIGVGAAFSHANAALPYSLATGQTTGLIVPLYTYPGSTWDALILQKQDNPSFNIIAIINPDSGPGIGFNSNYQIGIENLQNAGITVLGYVATGYGGVSQSSIVSQVSDYKAWYNVNGIYYDETSNNPSEVSYYQAITTSAENLGFTIAVGGAGATVPGSFDGIFNILVVYENAGLPSNPSSLAGAGNAIIAYGVPSITRADIQNLAQYVSYIYVTDATLPNPYGVLPSYLSSMVTDLAPSQTLTQTISTMTTTVTQTSVQATTVTRTVSGSASIQMVTTTQTITSVSTSKTVSTFTKVEYHSSQVKGSVLIEVGSVLSVASLPLYFISRKWFD